MFASTSDRQFKKQYKKLSLKIRNKFNERLEIFLKNPFNSILNNHDLRGEYYGCQSINITGDYRAVYFIKSEAAIFIRIGTHSELFGK